eukprot:TRINITY_DN8694_c0_g4_i1.p1 TRINITY_DN8694_c0_g4~~TRINITY_DN8694_c0_g4_i1.p1  ORF type:complete len:569 (-),score=39.29 TRINITY_DN8694_c0_g4_i1:596-2233(-)
MEAAEEENAVHRYAFLSLGGLLLCAALCKFLQSEIYNETFASLCSALTWVKLHVCCFRIARTGDEDETIEKYVVQELKAHEGKRMENVFAVFATSLFVVLGASWINALMVNDGRLQSTSQEFLLCVGLLLSLIGLHCRITSSMAVYVLFAFSMFYCCAFVQFSANLRFPILWASVQMACLRLCFIASGLSAPFVAFGNILCCFGNSLAFLRAPADASLHYLGPLSFFLVDFALSITIAFGSGVIRALVHREIHKCALEKSNHFENDALTTFLENSYDVTLTLNADSLLEGDSTRFAAMVMADPARPLQGSEIQEFMPFEEDRERFNDQLRCKHVFGKPGVICLSVYMRDALGGLFSVEIVGVAFRKIDQTVRYRLGIREVADLHLTPLRRLRHSTVEGKKKHKRSRRSARAQGTPPSALSSSFDSDCSDGQNELIDIALTDESVKPINLAVPTMKETTSVAKLSTAIALLRTWNFDASRSPCCLLHAGLPALKQTVDILSRGACQDRFQLDVSSQCEACGLLGTLDESQKCTHCGVENCVANVSL